MERIHLDRGFRAERPDLYGPEDPEADEMLAALADVIARLDRWRSARKRRR